MFLLTDVRALLRETAPRHELDPAQKEMAARTCEKIRREIAILERELT